jgi:hypothetical protein
MKLPRSPIVEEPHFTNRLKWAFIYVRPKYNREPWPGVVVEKILFFAAVKMMKEYPIAEGLKQVVPIRIVSS